jgi:hypothetical protein
MELLFSPCTRYRDIADSRGGLEEYGGPNPELLRELNLDISTEELLSAERAFSYADLYAMLINRNTVAWLTPHAAVVRTDGAVACAWEQLGESCGFCCSADGEDIVVLALSSEHLLEISDVVLRLLAVSVVHSVNIERWSPDGAMNNAPALAYLMEQCQSLKVLTLKDLEMDENHCRDLGDYSRPDLDIVLICCAISDTGANALAEVLGHNQGPTKLHCCFIDNFVLANGLRGNSRLKSLTPKLNRGVGSEELLVITDALRENKGLLDLNLSYLDLKMSDETWDAVCDSLETHPTLEVLDLRSIEAFMAPAELKSRIRALVDMMKVNMSIHSMHLNDRYYDHELLESVIPFLETNRFRPRLLAIQKTVAQAYRAKVLGRALLAVQSCPNRFWMLLSGNAEVAFPSTTATTTTAASLPTPANVAATENVAPVVATASATAASSAVVSAAGQKRKACP